MSFPDPFANVYGFLVFHLFSVLDVSVTSPRGWGGRGTGATGQERAERLTVLGDIASSLEINRKRGYFISGIKHFSFLL